MSRRMSLESLTMPVTESKITAMERTSIIQTVSERVTVETLLLKLEQERESDEKCREYIHQEAHYQEVYVEQDIFKHQGVYYWEGRYNDVVVVPSLSLDSDGLAKVKGIAHYEERQLYSLILLRKPRVRLIYVTSMPLDQSIIEYYWRLLPEKLPISEMNKRLILYSVHDDSIKPLSQKILEKPGLLQRIKRTIRDTNSACLTCFNSSVYEARLAEKLGIPLLGTSPDTIFWGTKIGSHLVFEEAGIQHPKHTPLCNSGEELAEEIVKLLESLMPDIPNRLVLKLNNSFSGEGNAILDLSTIKELMSGNQTLDLLEKRKLIAAKLLDLFPKMNFHIGNCWSIYSSKLKDMGWLAEVMIEGKDMSSPSGQGCIDTQGNIKILSTHEQVLGGEYHQVYQGCSFPANPEYRMLIQQYTYKVGEVLVKKGVTDHFGVDYVVVRKPNSNDWDIYAIEINLRQGGTTHPMMTLKLLTDGEYNMEDGSFVSSCGRRKYYVASDNMVSPALNKLVAQDLIELFFDSNLAFNPTCEKGVVFHLLGALSKFGKVGATCIGDTPEEAQSLFDKTLALLQNPFQ